MTAASSTLHTVTCDGRGCTLSATSAVDTPPAGWVCFFAAPPPAKRASASTRVDLCPSCACTVGLALNLPFLPGPQLSLLEPTL